MKYKGDAEAGQKRWDGGHVIAMQRQCVSNVTIVCDVATSRCSATYLQDKQKLNTHETTRKRGSIERAARPITAVHVAMLQCELAQGLSD